MKNITLPDKIKFEELTLISKLVKKNMLQTIKAAKTGHVGACCSSNELLASLYFAPGLLRIDTNNPKHPDRDYVLVRGHLGPLRYNIFSLLGWLKPEEMSQYRKFGSRLCGHEDMNKTPGVDISPSGSLGMLLSYAVGARYSFRKRDLDNRVFCFLGDGEEQEGNVSEAARHASNIKLNNLIAIIDKNEKQLSTSTKFTDGQANLPKIWQGYGWHVLELDDGHNIKEIVRTYNQAMDIAKDRPVCIIAKTLKSNGIPNASSHYSGFHVYHNNEDDHGRNEVDLETCIQKLEKDIKGKEIIIPRRKLKSHFSINTHKKSAFRYDIKPDKSLEEKSSFDFLAEFLNKLSKYGKKRDLYVFTADYPPRALMYNTGQFSIPRLQYENVGIREQHLLSMIHGLKTVEKYSEVLVLCGDAFLYRFADQLNVLAQANSKVILYSMQAGVSGAKNGSTHQSTGQSGLALTMPGVQIYEPSSKLDWFFVMNKALNENSVSYIRTSTGKVKFDWGGFKEHPFYAINFLGQRVDCTIITNGILTKESVLASNKLIQEGILTRVVNVLDLKHLEGIEKLVEKDKPAFLLYNGNPLVLSYPVCRSLASSKVQPSKIIERGFTLGETGSVKDIMHHFGLDREGIYSLIKSEL